MCSAKSDVRFTPNSDCKRRYAAMVTTALHLKADMCSALAHVCFGPIADMCSASLLQQKTPERQRFAEGSRPHTKLVRLFLSAVFFALFHVVDLLTAFAEPHIGVVFLSRIRCGRA